MSLNEFQNQYIETQTKCLPTEWSNRFSWLGVQRYAFPMIRCVSRYGHHDTIRIYIHVYYMLFFANFVTYYQMSKYNRVWYIVTIRILIRFFVSRYVSWTAVSRYPRCLVYRNYRCTPSFDSNFIAVCSQENDWHQVSIASCCGSGAETGNKPSPEPVYWSLYRSPGFNELNI